MKVIAILIGLFLPVLTFAQKEVIHQQQLWFRYHLKVPIGDKWQIRQEFDDRNFINPSRQSQFLSRTHIERKLGKGWDVALGFTFVNQSLPQDPKLEHYNRSELRPSFEIARQSKLSEDWSLNNRLWAESRYIEQSDGSHPFSNFRFRYKIEIHYSISDFLDVFAFDELHINAGKNIVTNMFDQNRLAAGVQFHIVKNLNLELTYINWFQQQALNPFYYNRNIVRVAINHVLPVWKKTEN